jgi:hypothetical protein
MMSDGIQHLLLAILARAVRDIRHTDPRIQAEARQWLLDDPLCAEICEILGYSLPVLHQTVGLHRPKAQGSAVKARVAHSNGFTH